MTEIFRQLKTALLLLFVLMILTGILYPILVTLLAQIMFPWQANGSLIERNGKTIGSKLIGQQFTDPKYFWGRPSMTQPFPYNSAASSGSNSGPSNIDFLSLVKTRVETISYKDVKNPPFIPVELVTASASGLDPEISPFAAYYQVLRVANARHVPPEKINALIHAYTQERTGWLLGEPRVNVLLLNLAMDNSKW